jgi:hypothetical protein
MAWEYYRTITVDKTKVPNTDQPNFPVLVSGTYSYLATTGNGGRVRNANGHDVAFFSDLALTNKLPHEVEIYTATTGLVVYWVKVDLSTTADTVFYMAYADTGISTSQQDVANVWTGYKAVFHLKDGTTLSTADSANSNNGTATSVTAVAGKIDGAGDFGGVGNIRSFGSSLSQSGTSRTISVWVYPTDTSRQGVVGTRPTSGSEGWVLTLNQSAGKFVYFHTGGNLVSGGTTTANTWHCVAVVFNSSSGDMLLYVNGSLVTTQTGSSFSGSSAFSGVIGNENQPLQYPFTGKIDELRISENVRSADTLATEYNNQNSPSTFYTIGSETAPSASPKGKFFGLMGGL